MSKPISIQAEVAQYYSAKVLEHGETPRGVDWNGVEGQYLRFKQLMRLAEGLDSFSINDLGCGYGALVDYLNRSLPRADVSYFGFDISSAMVDIAQEKYRDFEHVEFETNSVPSRVSSISVASGIFNVKLDRSHDEWRQYIEDTLEILNDSSEEGFAFNCLTSYSDEEKMRPHLFYADPSWLFNLCKKRYSRNVALLHDYDLYEFTILVRKSR